MKTTQGHLSPQAEIRDPQPAVNHRSGVVAMVQDLVQPFLAIRTFVQKHPNFDPDSLVTKWQRVRRLVDRFATSIGMELVAIHGGSFGPEAHATPLPPLVPDTGKDLRSQAVQFITSMAGYAEDLLKYVQENRDTFSPTVAMNKIDMVFLAFKCYGNALEIVVQNMVTGRDPWEEPVTR